MNDSDFETMVSAVEKMCSARSHDTERRQRTFLDSCKAGLRTKNLSAKQYENALLRYMKALGWG
jgi:hypothetical protein